MGMHPSGVPSAAHPDDPLGTHSPPDSPSRATLKFWTNPLQSWDDPQTRLYPFG